MARVEYGAMITSLTGSVGGWTFQSNRAGNYVRSRPKAFKAPTNKQSLQQSKLIGSITGWRALAPAQKTLWDDYALLFTKESLYGQTTTLTGFNWYTSINETLAMIGEPTVDVPPAHTLGGTVPDYDIILTDTVFSLAFVSPSVDPTLTPIIRMSSLMTASATTNQSTVRLLEAGGGDLTGTRDLSTSFISAFGYDIRDHVPLGCFSYTMFTQVVSTVGGVQSSGFNKTFSSGQPVCGIGCMQIGSTFIVG